MAIVRKNDILLETGTNTLGVLEFIIAGRRFGINVSKVVEILMAVPITPMPNSNEYVRGVFKPRDMLMTLIDLPRYLNLPESENPERDIYIITSFNSASFAFHVHSVEVIHPISWNQIEKPDPAIYGGGDGLATGIARVDDKLITIIDFEKIIADISPSTSIQISDVERLGARTPSEKPVMVVEDSMMLLKLIRESLTKAGYTSVITYSDGQAAWDALQKFKDSGKPVTDMARIVITDIEMPKMDGHRLTKLIRDDPALKCLPVVIFSSLINDEMKAKGVSVGATAQIAKPDAAELVRVIDENIL
ncbi:MAG: chemotaxis protein [Clostridiales bacterium]|jgi:two-component system chemotaxis response regulator CheV|nr:chemotaxis protein [Clostridiales bacterium]